MKPLGREVITIAETFVDKETGEVVELPKEPIKLSYVKQLKGMGKTHKEIAERCGTTKAYIDKILYEDRKKQQAEAEAPKRGRGRPKGSKNKRTIAESNMLANWQNSPLAPQMREDKADLNRMAGWFVTECLKLGQTTDANNIDSLYDSLQKYVGLCTTSGMPMLVKTCNLALGVNGVTLTKWKNGTQRANDPRYREFAELVEAVISAGIEAAGAAGALDKILTIYFTKAHFNYSDQPKVQVEINDPMGEKRSAKEIVESYSALLPEDN